MKNLIKSLKFGKYNIYLFLLIILIFIFSFIKIRAQLCKEECDRKYDLDSCHPGQLGCAAYACTDQCDWLCAEFPDKDPICFWKI